MEIQINSRRNISELNIPRHITENHLLMGCLCVSFWDQDELAWCIGVCGEQSCNEITDAFHTILVTP